MSRCAISWPIPAQGLCCLSPMLTSLRRTNSFSVTLRNVTFEGICQGDGTWSLRFQKGTQLRLGGTVRNHSNTVKNPTQTSTPGSLLRYTADWGYISRLRRYFPRGRNKPLVPDTLRQQRLRSFRCFGEFRVWGLGMHRQDNTAWLQATTDHLYVIIQFYPFVMFLYIFFVI